jgi:hypothetical protein
MKGFVFKGARLESDMVAWRCIPLNDSENKERSNWFQRFCQDSDIIYHGMNAEGIKPLLNLFPTTYATKVTKFPTSIVSADHIQNICSKNIEGYEIYFYDSISRDPEDQSLSIDLTPLIISSTDANFPYIRIDSKQNSFWGCLFLLVFVLIFCSMVVYAISFNSIGGWLFAALFLTGLGGIIYYYQVWLTRKFNISYRELTLPESDTFGKRFSVHCEKGKEEITKQLLTIKFREYFTNTFTSWRGGGIEFNQNAMLLPHAAIDKDADLKFLIFTAISTFSRLTSGGHG